MEITTTIQKGVLIARVAGELDMRIADRFRDQVDQEMQRLGTKDLVIDLGGVDFIDSSGIGVILGRYKRIQHMDGHIALVGVCESVQKLLNLAGILTLIRIFDDENKAIACF